MIRKSKLWTLKMDIIISLVSQLTILTIRRTGAKNMEIVPYLQIILHQDLTMDTAKDQTPLQIFPKKAIETKSSPIVHCHSILYLNQMSMVLQNVMILLKLQIRIIEILEKISEMMLHLIALMMILLTLNLILRKILHYLTSR